MSRVLGMDGVLYRNTGTYSVAVWNEVDNVRDLTLNLEKADADATTRGNNGWRASLAGIKDGSVDFEMVWDTADAGFDAIHDSFFNNEKIGLSILDGVIATGTGLQGDFAILNMTRNEPLEDVLSCSVSAKLTYSADEPIWLEGGSEPTGTDTY